MAKWFVWLLPALLLFSCTTDAEEAQEEGSGDAQEEAFDYDQVRDIEKEEKELREELTATLDSVEVRLETLRAQLEQASELERSQYTDHITQLVIRRKQIKRRLEKIEEGLGQSWGAFYQRTKVLITKVREDLKEADL